MPRACNVLGCSSQLRQRRRLYNIPSERNNQGHIDEGKIKRRNLWLEAIDRNLSDKIDSLVVCEEHFVTGRPVHEEGHPDWVPSLRLPVKRKVKSVNNKELDEVKKPAELVEKKCPIVPAITAPVITSVYSLPSEKLINKLLMHEDEMSKNREAFRYYTGFSFDFGTSLLKLLSANTDITKNTFALTSFQQFMLTMMKLRLNFQFTDLGYRFNVSRNTASRFFFKWIDCMYSRLRSYVRFPTRAEMQSITPSFFREQYGDKLPLIIYCFSIFTEKSMNTEVLAQQRCSNKSQNCIKYMIGLTPNGHISFISNQFVGALDSALITNSGVLENFQVGDFVVTDRSFLTDASVGSFMAELVQSKLENNKFQLEPRQIANTSSRDILKMRMQAIRSIGVLKTQYSILSQILSRNMLTMKSDEGLPTIDKIVTVCCALINLAKSV